MYLQCVNSSLEQHVRVLSCFSHVWLFATLWTIACQIPLCMGFSRQEYWTVLLCPPTGDLPDPGMEPTSRMPPAVAAGFFTTSTTWEALLRTDPGSEIDPNAARCHRPSHNSRKEGLFELSWEEKVPQS